jgi:transcriptional regulator with XRE-family HTH domain
MVMDISERIRELEVIGITQSNLASALNISRSAVNAWEMGTSKPSIDTLVDLADFFHVSTDYLLGRNELQLIEISGVSPEGVDIILRLVHYFSTENSKENN